MTDWTIEPCYTQIMANPIAIFGTTSEEFSNKVIELRKAIRSEEYDNVSDQMYTIPHLTLAFNNNFNSSDFEKAKEIVTATLLGQSKFTITVKAFIIMENNIAALFDNSFTNEFAKRVSQKLEPLGFEVVQTDHMRLIRSEVKEEFHEIVRKMVNQELPREIEINGIAMAGKLLRKEDLLWNISLA